MTVAHEILAAEGGGGFEKYTCCCLNFQFFLPVQSFSLFLLTFFFQSFSQYFTVFTVFRPFSLLFDFGSHFLFFFYHSYPFFSHFFKQYSPFSTSNHGFQPFSTAFTIFHRFQHFPPLCTGPNIRKRQEIPSLPYVGFFVCLFSPINTGY